MSRNYYLQLAEEGIKVPIAADLILHEKPNPEEILKNGEMLGRVIEESAHRFGIPLAISLMDLTIEKTAVLETIGIASETIPSYHFSQPPDDEVFEAVRNRTPADFNAREKAHLQAMRYLADETNLIPVGMSIGPFSLTTKLLSDPITPIYLAGMGLTGEDDPDVLLVDKTLELASLAVLNWVKAQIDAGIQAIFIAEPAANKVYISPKQIEEGSGVFERFVMEPNRRIKELLERHGVDLLFHCCGELTDAMVESFGKLRPAVLSLGSSRKLWKDAALIPKDVVLFGNLPSKKFYSDDLISAEQVAEMSRDLLEKMKETGHPFILGTECDVLSVEGCEESIMNKVCAMLNCPGAVKTDMQLCVA